jgi:hypothetical protein
MFQMWGGSVPVIGSIDGLHIFFNVFKHVKMFLVRGSDWSACRVCDTLSEYVGFFFCTVLVHVNYVIWVYI